MPDNKIKQKRKWSTPFVYCDDGMGGKVFIRAPVLLSIFRSTKLIEAYKKNPERTYSVKEIFDLSNRDIPVEQSSIRKVLTDNKIFFETRKEIEVRRHRGTKTVMVINFAKLKPIAKFVFDAIEEELMEDE